MYHRHSGISKQLRVIEWETGQAMSFPSAKSDVFCVQFDKTSNLIYFGTRSGSVFRNDMRTPFRGQLAPVVKSPDFTMFKDIKILRNDNYLLVNEPSQVRSFRPFLPLKTPTHSIQISFATGYKVGHSYE